MVKAAYRRAELKENNSIKEEQTIIMQIKDENNFEVDCGIVHTDVESSKIEFKEISRREVERRVQTERNAYQHISKVKPQMQLMVTVKLYT